jgi:hypothetical protein
MPLAASTSSGRPVTITIRSPAATICETSERSTAPAIA